MSNPLRYAAWVKPEQRAKVDEYLMDLEALKRKCLDEPLFGTTPEFRVAMDVLNLRLNELIKESYGEQSTHKH